MRNGNLRTCKISVSVRAASCLGAKEDEETAAAATTIDAR